jgi:uncharacterized protein (UPF0248 family)
MAPPRDKKKKSAPTPTTEKKKARMRPAIDVIHRYLHDPACDASRCTIGYHDRLLDAIVEKPLLAFSHWGDIASSARDDLAIPQHRIVYFKHGASVVWDKRPRLDAVFGSTAPHARVDLSSGRHGPSAADAAPVDASTPLQRYLASRNLRAFDDVAACLRGDFRCKVRTGDLGHVRAYFSGVY